MDLRQLRYFAAIAEHASFRAAADELRLAQPALSQQMRRLENELGVELFDRSTRPIRVTDAGRHLLPRARAILADVDRTVAEVRDFSAEPRGRLAVGVMQYLTSLELPDLLADFNRRHPLVELGLRVGNTGQLFDGLAEGDIDIVICHDDELGDRPDLTVERLRVEELVIVVGLDDPRAGRDTIRIEELADAPLITFRRGASIRDAMMSALATAGLTQHVAFESADMSTALGLVARGLGVALVPRSIADREPSVAALRVVPAPLVRHVALAWRRDRHSSRAHEAFRAMTHAAMQST